jgi:hypothetical protein
VTGGDQFLDNRYSLVYAYGIAHTFHPYFGNLHAVDTDYLPRHVDQGATAVARIICLL